MTINFVLDIDGVLSCAAGCSIKQASFFKNKGALITALKTHYIFPGVLEFIKFLSSIENSKISFFSSAQSVERNKIFAHELLKLSLDESKYKEIRDKTIILSNDDLSEIDFQSREDHYNQYQLKIGKKQKDLSKALNQNELLKNAILIEDNLYYVAYGQAKNILYVPETDEDNFKHLSLKCDYYEPNGYRYFTCVLASQDREPEIEGVKQQKQILISKIDKGFEISFLDKESQYQTRTISSENSDLIDELEKIHLDNLAKNKSAFIIRDKELIRSICQLVGSFEGLMQKICRSTNRIFYATGLLFKALSISKAENIPISEALFGLQFKKKKDGKTYKPTFKKLNNVEELYFLGLETLRKYNPHLQLITPHYFVEHLKLPISLEEQQQLQEFLKNENKASDCSIM